MERLLAGLAQFRRDERTRFGPLLAALAREGQHPRALFITCADSRITPHLFTQSGPGDLFVLRNIGNIVPPPDTAQSHSVAAAIEYAVHHLRVPHIIVCGHTDCGAMKALLHGLPAEPAMPHLRAWLEWAAPVRAAVAGAADPTTAAAEYNVRRALEHLRGYPGVAERLATGALQLHGWMFHLATAEMFAFDPIKQQFQLLTP